MYKNRDSTENANSNIPRTHWKSFSPKTFTLNIKKFTIVNCYIFFVLHLSILAVRHKTIQRTLIKTSKEMEENKTTLSTIYRTPLVHQHVHRITIIKTAVFFYIPYIFLWMFNQIADTLFIGSGKYFYWGRDPPSPSPEEESYRERTQHPDLPLRVLLGERAQKVNIDLCMTDIPSTFSLL